MEHTEEKVQPKRWAATGEATTKDVSSKDVFGEQQWWPAKDDGSWSKGRWVAVGRDEGRRSTAARWQEKGGVD